MGTGKYVNFDNGGQKFNIAVDTAGHMEFLANDHSGAGDRRMSILDDTNEVSVDGAVTVGGSGHDGELQLRASDGANTVYLGSSDSATKVHVGAQDRPGELHLYDRDHNPTVDVYGDKALLTLGADGQAGDLYTYDAAGKLALSVSGATRQLALYVDGLPTISLDGTRATVTVGSTANGVLEVVDNAGTVRIRLSADTGTIEFFDKTGASTAVLP